MSKVWDIVGLMAIIVIAVFAFPQETSKVFQSKFYWFIFGLLAFLILFFVWLRFRMKN